MEVHATFKGENGSLGYYAKMHYILIFAINNGEIEIYNALTFGQTCTYSSMKAFLENWEVNK